MYVNTTKRYVECNNHLPWDVYNYSIENFNYPLCRMHQEDIRHTDSTPEAIELYFALRARVPAMLDKFDGHKTIDIAIPDAMVNIEVDGMQYNFSHKQAFSVPQRTNFYCLKGMQLLEYLMFLYIAL